MKQRQANMELMRVVSMLLVLLVHTLFYANGRPTKADFIDQTASAFLYVEWEALALVCVNCFILISGYFGINIKMKSLFRFFFIVYFYRFVIDMVVMASGIAELSTKQLLIDLYPLGDLWFINAYIGLLLFVPLLNAFIEKATKSDFRKWLIVYIIVLVTIGSIRPNDTIPFDNGYGLLSFIGLYLIGRYYRLYVEINIRGHKRYLCLYFALCTLNAIAISLIAFSTTDEILGRFLSTFTSYDNALTIAASVSLMIFFSRLTIRPETRVAKFICWIAASAFAVYILNMNPYITLFWTGTCRWLMEAYWPLVWPVAAIAFCICFYTACLLIDQLRLLLYNKTQQMVSKMFSRIALIL